MGQSPATHQLPTLSFIPCDHQLPHNGAARHPVAQRPPLSVVNVVGGVHNIEVQAQAWPQPQQFWCKEQRPWANKQ